MTEAQRARVMSPMALAAFAAGAAVSVFLGVYGRTHDPTGETVTELFFKDQITMKAWLATAAVFFVVVQVTSALRLYGKIGAGPTPSWLGDVHRQPPAAATTTATEFAFDSTETLVAPGGTATWTNDGTKPHTATFDDIELDTGRIEPEASASLIAPGQPGSYSYYCSVHPDKMRGVLVVSPEPAQEAAGATPAAATKAGGDDSAGTVFAWLVALLVVGTGCVGLAIGLRRRPSAA